MSSNLTISTAVDPEGTSAKGRCFAQAKLGGFAESEACQFHMIFVKLSRKHVDVFAVFVKTQPFPLRGNVHLDNCIENKQRVYRS